MSDIKRRFGLLGLFAAVAIAGGALTQGGIDSSAVGASPLGRKAPYRIEVTLETRDLIRPFVHKTPLTRSQYEDVRFNVKKFRKRAVKDAKKALAKKLGYEKSVYGSSTQYENAKVTDVVLIDNKRENRRDGRISILRNNTIPL